jgi:hypothetical protein
LLAAGARVRLLLLAAAARDTNACGSLIIIIIQCCLNSKSSFLLQLQALCTLHDQELPALACLPAGVGISFDTCAAHGSLHNCMPKFFERFRK